MTPPLVGYWDIRGLAAPIRYLLEFAGVDYEEKRYSWRLKPGSQSEFTEYQNEKYNLGLDFPNLPYYIDDDVHLTQSQVITRYLARKHNLAGANALERTRADLLASQVIDYKIEFKRLIINPDFLNLKAAYARSLPDKLKLLAYYLGVNKFAVGDNVTYADFVLFEFLEGQLFFNPDLLNDFPMLKQYHKRVLALEPIDRYFKSPRSIKLPYAGGPAFFTGPYLDSPSRTNS